MPARATMFSDMEGIIWAGTYHFTDTLIMQQSADERWSACYERGKDFSMLSSATISKLLSFVATDLAKTCLDIGCGTGQLTRELAHRGYQCVGLDVSSTAIKMARSLTVSSDISYRHFDIEADDITRLPRQAYSLITCKLVYVYIQNRLAFLKTVQRLLALGGVFIVITPLAGTVPPERADIAVDYEQTKHELERVFSNVHSYEEQGLNVSVAYFVCRKKPDREAG